MPTTSFCCLCSYCSENETLRINKNENSGVKWIPAEKITEDYFAKYDVYLYNKLIKRARDIKAEKNL